MVVLTGTGGEPLVSVGARPAVHAVLVTYRRPNALAVILDRIAHQTHRPDRLVVVDNAPTSENRRAVCESSAARNVVYLASPENIGPAGGITRGLELILRDAGQDDWVALFDDDDPPSSDDVLGTLLRFALYCRARDPAAAGVGLAGARFDPVRGRIVRIRDDELTGAVRVHYLGGGQLPLYRVSAIRHVGPFRSELFFGFEELEFGWRLARAGYHLYVPGVLWRSERERHDRLGVSARPGLTLTGAPWRRYYSTRNLIHILRTDGRWRAATRVTVLALAKVGVNLAIQPRAAAQHLKLTWRACRDGWIGRLGRSVEPPGDAAGAR